MDLEKIAQTLVNKLLEKGLLDEAQEAIEGMLLTLSSGFRKPLAPIKSAASGDWEHSLELLLRAHDDTGRKQSGADECAVIATCLHSVLSLCVCRMESPAADRSHRPKWLRIALAASGPGCLRWARDLLAVDPDSGRKACGNLARAVTRTAALAESREEGAAAAVAAAALETGLELRRLSIAYAALHGRSQPGDQVAQWIKYFR
jgi:hypothetical protein